MCCSPPPLQIQIESSDNTCFALTRDGEILGWGSGETHQLCQPDEIDIAVPIRIPLPPKPDGTRLRATQLSVGKTNCAVLAGMCLLLPSALPTTPHLVCHSAVQRTVSSTCGASTSETNLPVWIRLLKRTLSRASSLLVPPAW